MNFAKPFSLFVVSFLLLGAGCSTSSTPLAEDGALPPDAWCYALVDDPTVVIMIEPDALSTITLEGQTIWHDTITVVEEGFEPQTTIGEIDNDKFFYADGSGFQFRSETAEGFGSSLEGMNGTRTDCPILE